MEKLGRYSLRPATDEDSASVRGILSKVLIEYGLEPDFENTDKDLFEVATVYEKGGGVFYVIEGDHDIVLGMGGLMKVNETEIELRKMYFLPELRGQGLGREFLGFLIQESKKRGFARVVLETNSVLKEAIGLYKSFGFIESKGIHADRCDSAFYLDLK